jgi:hypothetical protein
VAIEQRYSEQMPWVGTKVQKELVDAASAQGRVSKAWILRESLDSIFGLRDGELPPGVTIADAIKTGMDRLRQG